MDLFIDSANLDDIRDIASMGILDGVTTNPSLVAREGGVDFHEHLAAICKVVPGPVSAEVVSTEHEGMLQEAAGLVAVASNIVIKLPCTIEGLRACKALAGDGVRVNMTLCFQPLQALLAAKAGAFLISPFLGRIDDIGGDGMDLVRQIRAIYDTHGYETKLLAASIRNSLHLVQAALLGADAVTVPPSIVRKMMHHPLTDSGLAAFLADWKTIPSAEPAGAV